MREDDLGCSARQSNASQIVLALRVFGQKVRLPVPNKRLVDVCPLSRPRGRGLGRGNARRLFGIAKPHSSPLQGASALACADRSAGSQHAARNPYYTLALTVLSQNAWAK